MTDESINSKASLLEHYIDDMSEAQQMTLESQRELQRLRQDAKTDGLNVDALNLLIQVRSRTPPDGGTRILNDLVSYAISVGIQFDQVISQSSWELAEKQHVTSILPEEQRMSPSGQRLLNHIRLSTQLALGALLSATMLWYLR